MIYVALLVLGLCLGSFVNALVFRLHMQSKDQQKAKSKKQKAQLSLTGRSMCPNCKHGLAVRDLVPILSWLSLRGRCRYCRKLISIQYPIVEAITGLVFVLSYLLWPAELGQAGQWLLIATWLASSVGLIALAIYDLRWMILPNRIMYPSLAVAVAGRGIYIAGYSADKTHDFTMWLLSIAVAAGVFVLLYITSSGKWIGFGDVRLGLVTGTILATPLKAFLMIFGASLLGLIAVLPSLITKKTNLSAKIPYGPFLIAATFFVVLFGDSITDWYSRLLTP